MYVVGLVNGVAGISWVGADIYQPSNEDVIISESARVQTAGLRACLCFLQES